MQWRLAVLAFVFALSAAGPKISLTARADDPSLQSMAAATDPAEPSVDLSGAIPASNDSAVQFFESRIRPLLIARCQECHSKEAGPQNGGLVLETLQGVQAGGERGPILMPGHPEESLLVRAVTYQDPDLEMPPSGKMPDAEIALIAEWIRQGGVVPVLTQKPQAQVSDVQIERARNFWSFVPLHATAPPVKTTGESQHPASPVDAFVTEQMQQNGITHSPPTDRRTLLRRVSFDLTGLPPTFSDVVEFENDRAPDAYARVVDRLLASPHYGERWGRVWLDLVRYADSGESWLKTLNHAWRYRDWVVRSFNENRRYDEFVKLQLAADLLPGVDPADQAALGFLGLAPTYWKELRLAPPVIEQIVADEWDERIDTVSQTVLGLTVACARCHDHKFDPITAADYYALAGIFASTQIDEIPLLPAPEAALVKAAHQQVDALQATWNELKDKDAGEAARLQGEMAQLRASTTHFDAPWVHIVKDSAVYVIAEGDELTKLEYRDHQSRDLPVFRRGSVTNPGDKIIPRQFLSVLRRPDTPPFGSGSGRRELAESLFSDAAALSARVWVNRVWGGHFLQGIVRSPSNFGAQGELPTHPALLEWLSREFVDRGYDTRALHRQIIQSDAYQQASSDRVDGVASDPEIRWLWRMPRRRLDIEMWRDAMLSASGCLKDEVGGIAMSLDDAAHRRRTLYGRVDRPDLVTLLRLYDFPEATTHSAQRSETTTPLQLLYFLNGDFVRAHATMIASSLPQTAAVPERVERCYQRLFQRAPTGHELQIAEHYFGIFTNERAIEADAATSTPAPEMSERWITYVHALLTSNEFYFVD